MEKKKTPAETANQTVKKQNIVGMWQAFSAILLGSLVCLCKYYETMNEKVFAEFVKINFQILFRKVTICREMFVGKTETVARISKQ